MPTEKFLSVYLRMSELIELKGRRRWSSLKHGKGRQGSFTFGSQMRNDTDSAEVVEDAAVGSEVWVDNHIRNPVVKG